MLVTSNFSFSQDVSTAIYLVRQNAALCDNGLKMFADDKSKVAQMAKFVPDRAENDVGKGDKNVGYQHFLLFPLCFQKASFTGSLQPEIVWERVKFLEVPV